MKQIDMLETPVKKLFFRYLMPSVSATLVTSIYILADTVMVGWGVGAQGIAALNLLLPLFSLYLGTGILFGVGGSVLFSISKGRQDEEAAKGYFTAACLGALAAALVYLILGQAFYEPITRMLGKTEFTSELVDEYGRILVMTSPVFLCSSFLQAFVRNDKAPKTAMLAVISGGVSNVFLDYIFIFPLGMGMAGAVIASVIGTLITITILAAHFFTPHNTLKFTKHVRIGRIREVFVNGLSSFLVEMASGVVMFLFNRQLLRYVGDIGVVVYGIISNSALVAASISNGIAQAAQPVLAVNFGGGRSERVKEAMRLAEITAVIAGVLFMLSGLLFPETITGAFVEPVPEILTMAVPAVRTYFLSFSLMACNILFSTYFQSVMKPGYSLFICLLRGMIVSTLLVFLLPLALDVMGIWITMPLTEFITFLVCIRLLRKQKSSGQIGKEQIS